MNIWKEWLDQKLKDGTLTMPEPIKPVVAAHGIILNKTCNGCLHLRRSVARTKAGKIASFRCTQFGGEQEWDPNFPACGKREEKPK